MIPFKNFFVYQEAISLQNAKDMQLKRTASGAYNIPVLNRVFGKKDRLVYNLDIDNSEIIKVNKIFLSARDVLSKAGYSLDTAEDYIKGLAYAKEDKDKKQPTRIGKILQKNIENSDKYKVDIKQLADSFRDDPVRTAKKKNSFKVVISRHPYDIAGMSTDRSWRSCMNLGFDPIEYYTDSDFPDDEGSNADYVSRDIEVGTIVAYLISSDDVHPNGKVAIRRPLSRILMKPFASDEDPNNVAYSIGKIYGANSKPFTDFIKNWLTDTVNTDTTDNAYVRNVNLYNDDDKPVNFEISTLPPGFRKPYKQIVSSFSPIVQRNVAVKYLPTNYSATQFGALEFKISFPIPKDIYVTSFSNHIWTDNEITKQLRPEINEVIKSTLGLSSRFLTDVVGYPNMSGFEFRNYIICSYMIMNPREYKNEPAALFKDLGLEKLNWEATMTKLQEVLKPYTEKYEAQNKLYKNNKLQQNIITKKL